jgi:hypothetical protein
MALSTRWLFVLKALTGAALYFVFLYLSYGGLKDSYIPPSWWPNHLQIGPAGTAFWFVLINAAGAIFAAIPPALFLGHFAKAHKLALGLAAGVPAGLYIIGGGLIEYGLPHYPAAWIIEAFHFLSISAAVAVLVACIPNPRRHVYL